MVGGGGARRQTWLRGALEAQSWRWWLSFPVWLEAVQARGLFSTPGWCKSEMGTFACGFMEQLI